VENSHRNRADHPFKRRRERLASEKNLARKVMRRILVALQGPQKINGDAR